MTGVRRALLLNSGERYAAFGLNFLVLAAVSRLLTPAEIGVAVVGVAIATVIATAREFAGLGYLIQKQNFEPKDARGAFTVLFLLTAAIALALAIGAPHASRAFGKPELLAFLWVVAAALMVETVAVTVTFLLRREFRFGKVAAINLTSAGVNAAVVIALAYTGFGFMSYAWGWLAGAALSGAVALALRPDLSVFRPSRANWRDMLRFGGYHGLGVLCFRVFEQSPYAALGRAVAPEAAAVFHRGLAVAQLPDKALSGVAAVLYPAFSIAARDGRPVAPIYLQGVAIITALVWPANLFMALMADAIVTLLLGWQWNEAVSIVRLIAISSLFTFGAELNYPALVAVGGIRDIFFRAAVVYFPGAALAIAAAFAGGIEAVALTLIVVQAFHAALGLAIARRRLGFTWGELGRAMRPSLAIAVLTALGPLSVVLLAAHSLPGFGELVLAGCLGLIGWLVGVHVTDHPLAAEIARSWRLGAAALRPQVRATETKP
jgi:O-antigen/teichoic acid export membrane protein